MKIDECINELKQYRFFSPEAEAGIKGLESLREQLRNLNKENIDSIINGVEEAHRRSLAYSNYIPKTVENFRFIKEWLEKKKSEV